VKPHVFARHLRVAVYQIIVLILSTILHERRVRQREVRDYMNGAGREGEGKTTISFGIPYVTVGSQCYKPQSSRLFKHTKKPGLPVTTIFHQSP
jgi:hypothetical protein